MRPQTLPYVVPFLVLPAATLALWLVRAVGSVRRGDGHHRLVPVLSAPFVALALVATFFLAPRDRPDAPGWLVALAGNGALTLVLFAGLVVLELPLWAVREGARRRRPPS